MIFCKVFSQVVHKTKNYFKHKGHKGDTKFTKIFFKIYQFFRLALFISSFLCVLCAFFVSFVFKSFLVLVNFWNAPATSYCKMWRHIFNSLMHNLILNHVQNICLFFSSEQTSKKFDSTLISTSLCSFK